MITLHYRVTLQEPTILTALEGEPNSSVSYDFIPGSAMRGFLIGAWMRQEGIRGFDASDDDVAALFFSTDVRYLNAYPVINDRRALPVPLSWREPKYTSQRGTVYDIALGVPSAEKKMSGVKGFVDYTGATDEAAIYRPNRVLNVHTQRARRSAIEQQVYRYDALAPGQVFEGVITCTHGEDADLLQDLLATVETLHLGGARSAGYGLAMLELLDIRRNWDETNRSPGGSAIDPQPGDTLIVTLLSDVIVRNEYANYAATPEALVHAFASHGITFSYGAYVALQPTLVGGFNRKWGLPLPQTTALRRGSVINMIVGQAPKNSINAMLKDGIGERTNEGFGQVAFDWQRHETLVVRKFEADELIPEESARLSVESNQMWQFMSKRLNARRVAQRLAASLFIDDTYRIWGDISPTQLSRLRARISDELRKPDPHLDFLILFLADIEGKAAGKQFENARIHGKSLASWLSTPDFNFVNEQITDNPQYMLQLIDAVLERAHKERTRKAEERV
jgi:CRISPR-associated protein Csx10